MNRIKELRLEMGWTQEMLGKKLSVQGAAISKYENENIPITDDTIKKLSEIFSASSDYILGISDVRSVESKSVAVDPLAEKINSLSDESKKELEHYMQLLKIKEESDKSKGESSSALERDA